MRKRLIHSQPAPPSPPDGPWLDLEKLAAVEVTSEDPAAPIEGALVPSGATGWRAAAAGEQTIRLIFDAPQTIRRVQISFVEENCERSQEFLLSWSASDSGSMRELVRQQFNFSSGSPRELEDSNVALDGVEVLELKINPHRSGGGAIATLAHLRVA